MGSAKESVKHGFVFVQLIFLALLSVGVRWMPLSGGAHNFLVFGIAFSMAALVLVQYMGLNWRDTLLFWIFMVPVILFAVLVVLLIPDIAHHPFDFLKGV
jgi:cytochrome c oxidase subunit IV